MNDQRALIAYGDHQQEENEDEQTIRDIHALTPPHPPPPPLAQPNRAGRRREAWETSSHRSSSLSIGSTASSNENFTTMSREFSALVMAGSAIETGTGDHAENNLAMIGEDDAPAPEEETNPLAIVPDNNPINDVVPSASHATRMSTTTSSSLTSINSLNSEISMHRVKREEVESKISAWQNAKIAKINNRFKREDAVINGWESEEVQKSTSWMKKVERKLEEKRARALEKMQNEVAKAHRKAEEKRASAEAKRGTKVSRVLDIANLMRAVGRPPVKRSFF